MVKVVLLQDKQELQEAQDKLESKLVNADPNSIDLAQEYENHFIYQNAAPSDSIRKDLTKLIKKVSRSEVQEFADVRRDLLRDSDFIFINV